MQQNQLKSFHNVALHGGFSNAARALNQTQPAISEQVRKLEQSYDVLLFIREHRSVRLTEQGEQLFLLTRQLFEVEDRISDYLSQTRTTVEGTLRIIVDSAHHITDILGRFRARYPKVFVSLRTGNTAEILQSLRSYTAEIGVLGSQITNRDMDTHDLGATQIIACASKDFPLAENPELTLAELAKLPLVFREQGSRTRQKLQEAASAQGVKLRPAIEIEGREAMREVVASGAGIGFVSQAEFGHDARLVQVMLKDVDIQMSETLVCMKQRGEVRAIRTFMRFASEGGSA